MYKNMILVIIFFLFANTYNMAQNISVKAGILLYNLYSNDTLKYNDIKYSFKNGYNIDALAEFRVNTDFFISTMIGLKTKSGKADGIILGTTNNNTLVTASQEFSFINVLLGTNILYTIDLNKDIKLKPYLGLTLEFNVSEKYTIRRTSDIYNPDNLYDPTNLNVQFNNSGISTNIGVRTQLNRFFFEFEYEWELYRMYLYDVGTSKSGVIKLIIGYSLIKL